MKIVFSHPPLVRATFTLSLLSVMVCPQEELITHIQVLCLAHGVVLSRSEAKELAIYLGQDTRKMLNTLQYWLPTLPLEGQRGTGAGNGMLFNTVALLNTKPYTEVWCWGEVPVEARHIIYLWKQDILLSGGSVERTVMTSVLEAVMLSVLEAVMTSVLEALMTSALEAVMTSVLEALMTSVLEAVMTSVLEAVMTSCSVESSDDIM